jgi:hypothetical protein
MRSREKMSYDLSPRLDRSITYGAYIGIKVRLFSVCDE